MSERGERSERSEPNARTGPEWATLTGATAVLLFVVSLLVVQIVRSDDPARPVAEVAGDVVVDGHHHVNVEVTNRGDLPAVNVQVEAELVIDGEPIVADQILGVLAGGASAELVFVFEDDPAAGSLRARVTSFRVP